MPFQDQNTEAYSLGQECLCSFWQKALVVLGGNHPLVRLVGVLLLSWLGHCHCSNSSGAAAWSLCWYNKVALHLHDVESVGTLIELLDLVE